MESETLRRSAVIFVMLMMVQVTLPMAANAQTNPPSSGDWVIPQGDVTVMDLSTTPTGQILLQGDLEVNGALTLDGIDLFIESTSNGQRGISVNSGELNLINGARILPYNINYCFDFNVDQSSEVTIANSTVYKACSLNIYTSNFDLNNSKFGNNIVINPTTIISLDMNNINLSATVSGVTESGDLTFGAGAELNGNFVNKVNDVKSIVSGSQGPKIYFNHPSSYNGEKTLQLTNVTDTRIEINNIRLSADSIISNVNYFDDSVSRYTSQMVVRIWRFRIF